MSHVSGTVENDTLLCESLSQIFGGLSLTGSCWTSWSTSKVKLESSHKCHVTLISERRDNETASVAEVLVTVREYSGNTLALAVKVLWVRLFGLPVVTELLDPLESVHINDLSVNKFFNDSSCVHIDNDESVN